VKIDASLEIEAQLRRRLDLSLDSNDCHAQIVTHGLAGGPAFRPALC
jgi:hypothetical protein